MQYSILSTRTLVKDLGLKDNIQHHFLEEIKEKCVYHNRTCETNKHMSTEQIQLQLQLISNFQLTVSVSYQAVKIKTM